MPSAVVFIDTSILCNLVPVPGKDQRRHAVQAEMRARLAEGEQFVLPITSVIETGNFIAQLPDGGRRRAAAETLQKLLLLVCRGEAPWVLHDVAWNADFLEHFLRGADTGIAYVDHAMAQVGAGDLCIITERDHYRSRTRVPARIWSLDTALAAHS